VTQIEQYHPGPENSQRNNVVLLLQSPNRRADVMRAVLSYARLLDMLAWNSEGDALHAGRTRISTSTGGLGRCCKFGDRIGNPIIVAAVVAEEETRSGNASSNGCLRRARP
jgi:hypothetical protein